MSRDYRTITDWRGLFIVSANPIMLILGEPMDYPML